MPQQQPPAVNADELCAMPWNKAMSLLRANAQNAALDRDTFTVITAMINLRSHTTSTAIERVSLNALLKTITDRHLGDTDFFPPQAPRTTEKKGFFSRFLSAKTI